MAVAAAKRTNRTVVTDARVVLGTYTNHNLSVHPNRSPPTPGIAVLGKSDCNDPLTPQDYTNAGCDQLERRIKDGWDSECYRGQVHV